MLVPSRAAAPLLPAVSSYASIVRKAAPAVVSISAIQRERFSSSLLDNDPFFNFFFRDNPHLEGGLQERLAKSLGSGVIVDPKGIVVTCTHVIRNAKEIIVKLSDNREFKGQVIAKDAQNDLAVIRLEGVHKNKPLPSISLETNDIQVGDVTLAIGDPFGVGQTVTSGIISAIARNVGGRILIQTDAPINPGNSGGALISMNGNLLGIPNAILSKTGASHGIGFAIPEPLIRLLLSSVEKGGAIVHPWAGVDVQQITPELASSLGMDMPTGVLVASLHTNSPARAGGLMQGDVITSLNGQGIFTPEDFMYRMQSVPLEQTITLDIQRNGENQSITFHPIDPPAIPAPDQRRIPQKKGLLSGMEVANLSPAIIAKYQLPADTPEKGVIITDTGDNMMALQLKLITGDIIEEVNQQRVESVDGLFNCLPPLQQVETIVIRHGKRRIEIKKN